MLNNILTILYDYNSESFMKSVEEINEKYTYQSEQISSSPSNMRLPYEFVDGLYVEENTNTYHKLMLVQRLIKATNYEYEINVTYITKKEE